MVIDSTASPQALRRFVAAWAVVFLLVPGMASADSAQETSDPSSATPVAASEPVAGYDPGHFNPFFIQDPTGKFRLNIGAYAQIRYEVNARSDVPEGMRDVETGWSLNRARFFFEGRYSDTFDFRIAINVPSDGQFDLQQVYMKYYMGDLWQVWLGKQFYNSMHEDWPDPTLTASMDNSAVDYAFALGPAFGALFHRAPVNRKRWWFGLNNGAYGANRNFGQTEESDVLVFGRLDYLAAGTDWSVWDDLIGARGLPFGVLLGLESGAMYRDVDTMGQAEIAAQVNADVSVNGDGYQVSLSGVWTGHDPKYAASYNNYGVYFQASYFLTDKWQGYVRYDFVSPGDQPGELEDYSAPGLGVNFFPFKTRRWRFSAELNHLFSAIDKTIVRPYPELGWLPSDSPGQTSLRCQVQFGF